MGTISPTKAKSVLSDLSGSLATGTMSAKSDAKIILIASRLPPAQQSAE